MIRFNMRSLALAAVASAVINTRPEVRTRPKPPPIDRYNHQPSDGSKPPEYYRKCNVPKKLRKKP
jgi:hypothetical protein